MIAQTAKDLYFKLNQFLVIPNTLLLRLLYFRSKGMKGNIGGVILFDETIRQEAKDGTLLRDIISDQGALPGIKVDKGLQPIEDCPN